MITKQEIKKELYKVDSAFEKKMTFSKNAIETYTNLLYVTETSYSLTYCFRLTESTLDDSFSFICIITFFYNEKEDMKVWTNSEDVFNMLKSM